MCHTCGWVFWRDEARQLAGQHQEVRAMLLAMAGWMRAAQCCTRGQRNLIRRIRGDEVLEAPPWAEGDDT